jgi:hypothetical protein
MHSLIAALNGYDTTCDFTLIAIDVEGHVDANCRVTGGGVSSIHAADLLAFARRLEMGRHAKDTSEVETLSDMIEGRNYSGKGRARKFLFGDSIRTNKKKLRINILGELGDDASGAAAGGKPFILVGHAVRCDLQIITLV